MSPSGLAALPPCGLALPLTGPSDADKILECCGDAVTSERWTVDAASRSLVNQPLTPGFKAGKLTECCGDAVTSDLGEIIKRVKAMGFPD